MTNAAGYAVVTLCFCIAFVFAIETNNVWLGGFILVLAYFEAHHYMWLNKKRKY